MNLAQAKSVFCLGIGGIGVSGLARILHAQGKQVSGCDLKSSVITEKLSHLGIPVTIGSNKVEGNPDLVIYSPAVPPADLASVTAPVLSHGQAVGELMEGGFGIAITGTNGKSTTTALLGLMLEKSGLDPTVLIGSLLSEKNESERFAGNARLGKSKYVVAEADEYQKKMLLTHPRVIVLTNIGEDHLDCYKDLAEIKAAFLEYVQNLPADGVVIYNADDRHAVEVGRQAHCHKLTFGINHYADLQALNIVVTGGKQTFDLHFMNEKLGSFELAIPGRFNISNALGAALGAIRLGAETQAIAEVLKNYGGLWRRFEVAGEFEGKPVVTDYAHHPDGVAATLQAAREFYPGKKILTVFQPHHRNRTKSLFGEFVKALSEAEQLIIPEIFDVAGREHGEDVSSDQLVKNLQEMGTNARFAQDLDRAEEMIRHGDYQFDVLLFMGAGDIDDLARKLVK